MGSVIQSMFLTILTVEFIMGNLGNGFIALVNCTDWVRRRKLSSVDHLLFALAISRIGRLWLVFLFWWISVFCPALFMTVKILRMISIFWSVTRHFSTWLVTSLSTFYFLKIANFSNPIFLYFKWRIKKVFSVICLVCLVLLFLNIVLINMHFDVHIDGSNRNKTCTSSMSKFTQISKLMLYINTVFTFIPFAVSLATFLLLICSLWKHLKKMQHNAAGSRDASTTAHIKALQTMISSVLLYTIFFLSVLLQIWSPVFLEENLIISFVRVTEIAFPSGHSFVLILGTGKLRRAFHLVLWRLTCRSKDGEPLGP